MVAGVPWSHPCLVPYDYVHLGGSINGPGCFPFSVLDTGAQCVAAAPQCGIRVILMQEWFTTPMNEFTFSTMIIQEKQLQDERAKLAESGQEEPHLKVNDIFF